MVPRQYIECMVIHYAQLCESKPNTKVTSLLQKNDHPEIDESELLDADGIKQYQSLID